MDINLVVVAGKLAAPPEIREFDSGATVARLLVTTRTDTPRRRVDVLPIVQWIENDAQLETVKALQVGSRLWVTGSLQRRFWESKEGRSSRVELVAADIQAETVEIAELLGGTS